MVLLERISGHIDNDKYFIEVSKNNLRFFCKHLQTFAIVTGMNCWEKAFEASGLPIDITHLSDTIKYSNLNVIVVMYMRQDRDT